MAWNGATNWNGINGKCHDGSEGVHLTAPDCPSDGCYQLKDSEITGNTRADKQSDVDSTLRDHQIDSLLEVEITSDSPMVHVRTYRGSA